jgi:hypothetical protein
MEVKIIPACFMAFLLISGCSGGGQHWYNHGKTRVDFEGNSQECEIIARELARQATLTGRREDQQTYGRAFDNCLYAKGWGTMPAVQPSPDAATETGTSLAVHRQNGTIEAFGRAFAVPAGFELQSDSGGSFGPTLIQTLLFLGPDSVYLNYTFQKSRDRKFEPTDYPVTAPFFLHGRGREEKKPDRLRWTVFAGEIREDWIVGLGGYLLTGKRERLTVVITRALPHPREPVPAGLNLSLGQFQAVQRFRNEWLPWLEQM